MSPKAGEIYYDVDLEIQGLITGQQEINKRLSQMEGRFDKTSQSISKFEGVLNKVGVAISAAFTIETAKKLIEIGDEMNTLQARVTRLSPSVDAAKESMKTLSSIASQTGNSLGDTERLWESLTTSLKSAGATNTQILQLTSTLQKIGTIGGSSTEEMSNALRQFGQSIAGGTVRAEEFNSILEQMPELARQIAAGMGISIGELRNRMLEGKLTAQDALNAIQKQSQSVNEEFDKMPVSIDRAKNSLDVAFKNAIGDLNQAIGLTSTLAGLMQDVANNLNFYNNNVGDSSRMPKLISDQKKYNEEINESRRWYETETVYNQRVGQARSQLLTTEKEIAHIRAKAAADAKSNQGFNSTTSSGDDKATKKLEQNSERRLALAKEEGEARARLQAQFDAVDAGVTDPKKIKALQDEYAETYRITEARKENNKEGKTSAAQQESIAQKLANLKQQSELAAGSTQELSREQAMLRAEQSLGSAATQTQINEAREYAAKIWDVTNALKMRQQAEQASRFVNQEVAAGKTSVNPVTGVAEDPNAQINQQEQQKLLALQKYQELGVLNIQQYEDAKTAIQMQAANARLQIVKDEAVQQSQAISTILGSAAQGFDGLANLIAGAAGKNNAAYAAMFALSKGFAVAQGMLNLQVAISNAMASGPYPANLAAMASVAAAGGQLLSTIGSISYSGAREHGGPVSANAMYRVGEGGKPEIFKASNGSQYMIPGDNGKVISNRDMQGGGAAYHYSPTIQINGNPDDKTIALVEAAVARGGRQVYQQISGDLAAGKGNVSKGLQSGWATRRRTG